jgi:pimeloyl-ACP methyl ester carboxylesterase
VRKLLVVAVLMTALVGVSAGATRAERPGLGVAIAPLTPVGPGQIALDVTVAGLQPDLHPTIEGTIIVGDRVIEGPRGSVVAARLPGVLDLAAGAFRLGGVTIFHFTPMPPATQNSPISVEVTVRQGNAAVTGRRSGMLLLPTVIVPGYLNDIDSKPDPDIVSALEQRGYHVTGASPTVFWFAYSRRFPLENGAKALAAYVRRTVLTKTYAARINVVGYSEGGLIARWALAFDPDWAHLVNQFVMIGVPNEGAAASYVYGWYPALVRIAATPSARDMFPTYLFWRPNQDAPWTVPPGARNAALARLNTQPLPEDVRIYALYGSATRTTWAGVTGTLPGVTYSYGPGDGLVLVASVLGEPIYGSGGVPGLADRLIKVDLGDVRHLSLFRVAMPKVAELLTRWGINAEGRR